MEITANAVQTVAPNQAVLFTSTAIPGNMSMMHREGSGQVGLRGITNGQRRARFLVTFGGNVALSSGTTVTPIQLAIAINGEAILTSSMISSPADTQSYNNIYTSLHIDVPIGCCNQISVKNIGTTNVDIQNANLIIERVA